MAPNKPFPIQRNSETWTVGQINEAIFGQWLIKKHVAKVRDDLVTLWAQVQELCHWAVAESVLQMVRIHRTAVRNDKRVER